MKKLLGFLFVGILLFTACQSDFDDDYDQVEQPGDHSYDDDYDDDDYDDDDNDDHENGGHDHSGAGDARISLYEVNGNSVTLKLDYDVPARFKGYQDDKALHQDIWKYVTTVLPVDLLDKVTEFELFFGDNETLGYVEPIDRDDLSKWRFALAIDEAAGLDVVDLKSDFVYTIIHEYGHVLSLNDEQIDATTEVDDCNQYHTGEGCAFQNSYINKIVNIGWSDILDQIGRDPEALYERYQDRFSTAYAATNPGEDIAEVFTQFIIAEDRPSGSTIAADKIRSLYKRDELAEMRMRIRNSIPSATLRTLNVADYHAMLPRLHRGHNH